MHKIRWLVVFPIALILSAQRLHATEGSGLTEFKKDSIFKSSGGNFSLGMRSTVNMFSDGVPAFGMGVGASARLQLLDRLNTEWFGDYMTSNLYNKANRTDVHIGWNVMFYILKPKGFTRKFTPFVAAGNCFDYSGIRLNGPNQPLYDRWTSAVQMSLGCHYNITPRFDISLSTLYMIHLGKEIDADLEKDGSVSITEHRDAAWEGHIMFVISVHYKIAKLWKPKG
jgi:hypothetical protein